MAQRSRTRPTARASALPLVRPRRPRFLPSARSLVVGVVIAAVAALAYTSARETSVFAVRTIDVRGGSPSLDANVRAALSPLSGRSLVGLRGSDVEQLAASVPAVASMSYDRAFPHTLRVVVKPEQPLAVLREGHGAWLVSQSGRVVTRLRSTRALPRLPRIWEPRSVTVALGAALARGAGAEEAAALGPVAAAGLESRVASVRRDGDALTYLLRGGGEVRAGAAVELPLKLAIAGRILDEEPALRYLDVSVPERPVGTLNPQVSGKG